MQERPFSRAALSARAITLNYLAFHVLSKSFLFLSMPIGIEKDRAEL